MNRYWESIIRPLFEKIKPNYIVEIGSEKGVNTANILAYCEENAAHMTAIDPHPQFDVEEFKVRYQEKFEIYTDLSLNILPLLYDYDFILLDGDHNWYSLFNELKIIENNFENKKFPMVILHDIGWPYSRRDLYYNPENIPFPFRQAYTQLGISPEQEQLTVEGGFNPHLYNSIYENNPKNGVLTAIEDFISESNIEFSFIEIYGFHGLGILFPKNEELENFVHDVINKSNIVSILEKERIKLSIDNLELEIANKSAKKIIDTELNENRGKIKKLESKLSQNTVELDTLRRNLKDKSIELDNAENALKDKSIELKNVRNTLKDKSVELNNVYNNLGHLEYQIGLYKELVSKEHDQQRETVKEFKKLHLEMDNLNNNFYEMEYSNSYRRSIGNMLISTFPSIYILFKMNKTSVKNRLLNIKGYKVIKKNNLLDIGYYLKNNNDVRISGVDPIIHYIFNGFKENRKPNPGFDGKYYFQRYGDVQRSNLNPLVHYALFGINERRKTIESPKEHCKPQSHKKLIKKPENFQIIQFTPENTKNPYYTMIGEELISRGIDFKYINDYQKIEEILEKRPILVHFHQPEPYYHAENKEKTLIKANEFLEKLRNIKINGAKVVFTMHNLVPHNRKFQDIDEMVNRELCKLSDRIVVLGQCAKEILVDTGVNTEISVINHPSYRGYYGPIPNKNQTRKELDLPTNAMIFGNVGHIKPYKGLEFIIEAFTKFSDLQKSSKQLVLCLVGSAHDNAYIKFIQEKYSKKNILIINRDLSDSDLIKFVSVMDYSVFAFKDIWASSSVVLSISYGVPVIVPELGCMSEYVQHLDNGLLYHPKDEKSLIETFELAMNLEYYDHLQYMCNAFSEDHTVSNTADEFLKMYKKSFFNI